VVEVDMKTNHRVMLLVLLALAAGALPTPAHAGQASSRPQHGESRRERWAMKGALVARDHHERAKRHGTYARGETLPKKAKHHAAKAFHKAVAFPAAAGAALLHRKDPSLRRSQHR
jgi:hypothetical protein